MLFLYYTLLISIKCIIIGVILLYPQNSKQHQRYNRQFFFILSRFDMLFMTSNIVENYLVMFRQNFHVNKITATSKAFSPPLKSSCIVDFLYSIVLYWTFFILKYLNIPYPVTVISTAIANVEPTAIGAVSSLNPS